MNEKLKKAIEKELKSINKAEERLRKKAGSRSWIDMDKLERKIPEGLNYTLQTTFSKAFGVVFKNGVGIIEKSYNKDNIASDYDVQNYAIERKGSRRELTKLKWSARKKDFLNMSITAVEGVGLGALGIGLPDIVLFIGMILKGIYEVALSYGYEYDSQKEKYFILMMMKTALCKDEEWSRGNNEIDRLMSANYSVGEDVLKKEIEETSKVFATDMLILKFIQGLPVVGVVGGVFNPVYYNKIMNFVRLKYHKRYLIDKKVR